MSKGKPKLATADLIAMYRSGMTLRTIAAECGVSFQSLAIQLRNAGEPRRPRAWRRPDRACLTCSATFHPKNHTQRFCSYACIPHSVVRRQTHCKRGHPLAGENVWVSPDGKVRRCKTCKLVVQRRWEKKRRQREGL